MLNPADIHNEMCRRAFGRQSVPEFTQRAIEKLRLETRAETSTRIKTAMNELVNMRTLTIPKEKAFRQSQPLHVRETQRHLNHEFILEAISRTSSQDIHNSKSTFREHLQLGVPVMEPIPKSFVLPQRQNDPDQPTTTDDQPKKQIKLRKKPPTWMTPANQVRLWEEFKASPDFNPDSEITPESFLERKREPVYAFGVEQGTVNADGIFSKLRRILDWREGNKLNIFSERIILYSHTCIFVMITLMMAVRTAFTPVCQYTKDLTYDTEATIKKLATRVEKILKGNPFTPMIGKLDFRKYYYQFGVRTPQDNTIGVWDPHRSLYRYFTSNSCQFGNLHSIYWAVRFSLALMFFLNEYLLIPCIIYIDDTIYFVPLENFEEARGLILFFYKLTSAARQFMKPGSSRPPRITPHPFLPHPYTPLPPFVPRP